MKLGIAFNRHFEVDGTIVYEQALRARLRGYRVETPWVALPTRPQ